MIELRIYVPRKADHYTHEKADVNFDAENRDFEVQFSKATTKAVE
jgi:hypothetical protein